MSTSSILRAALPLVPTHGFSLQALQASSHLPASTLNALFPSPSLPSRSRPRSLTRQELILDAQQGASSSFSEGDAGSSSNRERLGPARALVEAWLEEGRRGMVKAVKERKLSGERAVREGLEWRVRYNREVLDMLPDALGLLGAHELPLPVPSPIPVLEHVAKIGHSLALASHPDAQGTDWYNTRLRISLLYGLTELRLLAPPSTLDPEERTVQALETMDSLRSVGTRLEGLTVEYPAFIARSWMGIFRSLGL